MLKISLVVFIVTFLHSYCQHVGSEKLYNLEAHQNISLTCVDETPLFIRILPDEYDVLWKVKNKNSSQWNTMVQGPDTVVRDCNSSRPIDCIDGPVLSLLELRNVSPERSGTYACYLKTKEEETLVQTMQLMVGYRPEEAILARDGCTLRIVGSAMTCCWDMQRPTSVKTLYTMTYKPLGGSENSQNCSVADSICCTIHVENHFSEHEIFLTARNIFGDLTSVKHKILPSWHIKSEAPTNLQLKTKVDGKISTVVASWKAPNQTLNLAFDYRIRVSDMQTKLWKTEYGNKETRFVLEPLKSCTVYRVQVSARPVDIGGVNKGVWSDWSQSASIRTKVAAPSKNLYFTRSNTTVMSLRGKRYFLIDLKWYPYGNEKEDGFFSNITCQTRSGEKAFSVQNGTAVRFTTPSANISCEGAYCNAAGCSEYDYVQMAHQKTDMPLLVPESVKNVKVVSLDENTLSFTWDTISSGEVCSAQLCYRERSKRDTTEPAVNPRDHCTIDKFNFYDKRQIDCSRGFTTIVGAFNPCFLYIVIIQVIYERRGLVVQSKPSKVAFYDPVIKKISEFKAHDASSVYVPQIDVSFSNAMYPQHMQQELWYQPIGGSECSGNTGTTCGFNFRVNVQAVSNLTYCLHSITTNVFGSTEYKISHNLVCNRKRGNRMQKSNAVDLDTFSLETKGTRSTVITATTSPGSPRDVLIARYSPSQGRVSWKKPLHENGDAFYEVTRGQNSDSTSAVKYRTTGTNLPMDISCNPNDNTTKYSLTVTAVNELDDGTLVRGGNATLGNIACLPVEESRSTSTTSVLVIAICTSALAFTLLAIFLYYHRKTIKIKLKSHFWTPTPKPTIHYDIVSMREDTAPEILPEVETSNESYYSFHKDHGIGNDEMPAVIIPGDGQSGTNFENDQRSEISPNDKRPIMMNVPTPAESEVISEEDSDVEGEGGGAGTSPSLAGQMKVKQYIRLSRLDPTSTCNSNVLSEYERLEDASSHIYQDEEYVADVEYTGVDYVLAPSVEPNETG